jgi:hypothetical protein
MMSYSLNLKVKLPSGETEVIIYLSNKQLPDLIPPQVKMHALNASPNSLSFVFRPLFVSCFLLFF